MSQQLDFDIAQHNKRLVYTIISGLVVILLVVYINMTSYTGHISPIKIVPTVSSQAPMTQQQALAKIVQINTLTSTHSVLTVSEVAARASALAHLEAK